MGRVKGKRFGYLLRAYRKEKNMNQAALATQVNRASSDISRWERGIRLAPDRETVLNLADALKLDRDKKNQLLQAAGYMIISEDGLDFGNQAVREVATFLTSAPISHTEREKKTFEDQILDLVQIWHEYYEAHLVSLDEREETFIRLLGDLNRFTDRFKIYLWRELGNICRRQSRFQLAYGWFEKASLAARQLGDLCLTGDLLVAMGDTLRNQGHYDAIHRYQDAFEVFKSADDRLNMMRSQRKIASAYLMQGRDAPRALNLLKSGNEELEKLLSQDLSDSQRQRAQEERCKTLYYIGWAYSATRKRKQGIRVRERGLEIAQELQDDEYLSLGNRLLGDDYDNLGKLELAQKHYEQALKHCNQIADQETQEQERGDTLRGLGATLTKLGEWAKAEKCLNESAQIFRSDPYRLARTIDGFGMFYKARGDYQQAYDEHWRAKVIFKSIGNNYYSTVASLHLAEICYRLWDLEQDEAHLEQAQRFAQEAEKAAEYSKNPPLLARIQEERAYLALVAKEPHDEVRKLYAESCQTAREADVIAEYQENLLNHLKYLSERDHYEEAIELCNSLIELNQDETAPEIVELVSHLKKLKETANRQKKLKEEQSQAIREALPGH